MRPGGILPKVPRKPAPKIYIDRMNPDLPSPPPEAPPAFRPRFSWRPLLIFGALALVTVLVTFTTRRPNVIPEAGVNMELPEKVNAFWGTPQEVSEAEKLILPEDTEFAKMSYDDGTGNAISCQIVLSGSDRRSIHRPEACLPGQGWNMLANEPMDIELRSGHKLTVKKLRLRRDVEVAPGERRPLNMIFLYWYVGSKLTTHDQMTRVLRSNFDLLLYNRMHRWAYVIVSAPVLQNFTQNGLNEEQTLERLREFIRESVPLFQKSEMPTTPVETPGAPPSAGGPA